VERETKKRIQTRLTSHVSRLTLHNPHGSDVTLTNRNSTNTITSAKI